VNQHLSEEQLMEWLASPSNAEVEGHLQVCQACAERVARAAEPLTLFRGAVRSWGEEQIGPVRATWQPAATPRWGWRIAWAIATLWLLIAVPVYRHRQVKQETALTAAQDEVLLQQVERELSRSVPAPMEPLAKLMPNDLSR
jgi:hypothetical protein